MKTTGAYAYTLPIALMFLTVGGFCQGTKAIEKHFQGSNQVSEKYSVLKSDKKTLHGEYISYFFMNAEIAEQVKKGGRKLEDFVKKKCNYINGRKDGEWVEYSSPGVIETKGRYTNDTRTGIWETAKESGAVYERYDFDNNKKLRPEIKVLFMYPNKARVDGVEGTVTVSFKDHKDCIMTDIVVISSLSPECDKVAIDTMKRYAELQKKYDFDCDEAEGSLKFKFDLR